jgi:5-methylcytosine-specific restriction endonuclease McrA
MYSALILTPWMAPHRISMWHESISLSLGHKADVLEEYDEVVRSPSITVQIPAVLRLKKHLSRTKNDVKFSRQNLYTRDGYACQYCGHKFAPKLLTYDHVLPFSKGGKTTWENIATACSKCNLKKRNRTPEQAGMKLLKLPVKPKSLPLTTAILLPHVVPELWLPYLEGHQTISRSA